MKSVHYPSDIEGASDIKGWVSARHQVYNLPVGETIEMSDEDAHTFGITYPFLKIKSIPNAVETEPTVEEVTVDELSDPSEPELQAPNLDDDEDVDESVLLNKAQKDLSAKIEKMKWGELKTFAKKNKVNTLKMDRDAVEHALKVALGLIKEEKVEEVEEEPKEEVKKVKKPAKEKVEEAEVSEIGAAPSLEEEEEEA